jgi:uncharacterized protein YdeI (YjbR/CyaY-like superfamily)
MQSKEIDIFFPTSRQAWRLWLIENHSSKQAVWLVYGKKESDRPTITWSEAVEEALCFGWIDSIKKTIDADTFMQFFSKRKSVSTWSKINKIKVQLLIEQDLVSPAGYVSIETAKKNGSWTILDDVEELIIPKDLEIAFEANPGSGEYFLSLSRSVRKAMLQWLVLAKQSDTRHKRITEIAELAVQKLKPKQFR